VGDGSYVDELFGIATGYLGWPPSEAWTAAVPEILMAWEAKVEFLRATNPYGQSDGSGESSGPPPNETPEEKRQRIKAKIRGTRG
jgi:hypothetical protein